jgi:hypothetical protein
MKGSWLALTALLSAATGCNQAPDDDPKDVRTSRANQVPPVSREHRFGAGAAETAPPVKYELQGALAGPRLFSSKEKCDGARRAVTEAQAKADNQRSENGVPLPSRPMLSCVPA